MDLQNRLKDFIKTKKRTISSVAKAVDVSTATLHLWMNNKYEGNIKKINDAVARFLEIEELREGRVSLDFVKTTVADDVFDIAKTCHVENEIGVCYGEAGISFILPSIALKLLNWKSICGKCVRRCRIKM